MNKYLLISCSIVTIRPDFVKIFLLVFIKAVWQSIIYEYISDYFFEVNENEPLRCSYKTCMYIQLLTLHTARCLLQICGLALAGRLQIAQNRAFAVSRKWGVFIKPRRKSVCTAKRFWPTDMQWVQ